MVNGQSCKVLREKGDTHDLVHSALVEPKYFTGECVWIRQALANRAISLPVCKVKIQGSFGELETTSAVSDALLPTRPDILSNKTAKSLSNS